MATYKIDTTAEQDAALDWALGVHGMKAVEDVVAFLWAARMNDLVQGYKDASTADLKIALGDADDATLALVRAALTPALAAKAEVLATPA